MTYGAAARLLPEGGLKGAFGPAEGIRLVDVEAGSRLSPYETKSIMISWLPLFLANDMQESPILF